MRAAFVVTEHGTGVSKGVGYVSFALKEDAESVFEKVATEGVALVGRKLRVQWADKKVCVGLGFLKALSFFLLSFAICYFSIWKDCHLTSLFILFLSSSRTKKEPRKKQRKTQSRKNPNTDPSLLQSSLTTPSQYGPSSSPACPPQ